jgi:hypothetical protein
VRIFRRKSRSKKIVSDVIHDNIEEGSTIYTDDNSIYPKMLKKDFIHDSVNHSADEYVKGDVYTNSVENVWKRVKGNLVGTHISMSNATLRVYLYEICYRRNRRDKPDALITDLKIKLSVHHLLELRMFFLRNCSLTSSRLTLRAPANRPSKASHLCLGGLFRF